MKYFSIACFVILIALATSSSSYAQTAPPKETAVVVETPVEKKKFTTETVKRWLAEAFATTEAFRLKQAEHFTALREQKKAELKIDEVPELGEEADIGVGGTEPAPRPQKSGFQNPLEYGTYILSISLATLFTNQVIFYISSALLAVIALRFLVSRLV